jgi:hypothetical protein
MLGKGKFHHDPVIGTKRTCMTRRRQISASAHLTGAFSSGDLLV